MVVDREELECRGMDHEDEEEDEGKNEYEKDGFVVDDIEEEEEEEQERDQEERQKKNKKRTTKEEYVLDDDDYELLEDNNINVHRPKTKKFKRLKKGSDNEEQEFSGSGRTADDEGTHLQDIAEEEEDAYTGDEMADFIVDEEEVDQNGAPVRNKKPKCVKRPISSSALAEAQEIIGNVDELLEARNQTREKNDNRETRLEDEFEPIVLSEKYMTERDGRIRELDIPERMQISEESTGAHSLDGSSIDEESQWIVKQLKHGAIPWIRKKDSSSQNKEELPIDQDDIARFLELHHHHVQKLDIPLIAMYRKEKCSSLLKDLEQPEAGDDNWDKNIKTPILKWHKILWALQDLDRKWLLLQKRKSALQLYYNNRFEEESHCVYDEKRLNLNRLLFESVMRSLKEAESEREVDDVDSKFNLHFPPGEAGVDGQYKRPKRKSMYSTFSKAGLWEVASRFGCSSEQLGLCLSLVQLQELEDPKETPEEVASNFTCAMYDTLEEALKCARHMPLSKFEDAQWLLIQKAEEEKLIQVTIKLPEEYLNKLTEQFSELYISEC
ncbi:putative transcription elongation factor Spt6, Spt6 acidic domain-containing protein [Medicago truncatula]|uniref:Putative transcription elongation factor Spt6, Spt6 acidic domain-containing protein n=1 Tax=Medicago truncatula TaxID=3880 RepID=A0A396H782_MEDTR|nr:putative transcription elongation factor Spt6, Spt6 acidic domain-containing protein [Medicago truncatula]